MMQRKYFDIWNMELRQPDGEFRKQNILYMIFRCLLKMIYSDIY